MSGKIFDSKEQQEWFNVYSCIIYDSYTSLRVPPENLVSMFSRQCRFDKPLFEHNERKIITKQKRFIK